MKKNQKGQREREMRATKLLVLSMVIGLLVIGCASTNIAQFQKRWQGDPPDVLEKDNMKIYYYYWSYGEDWRNWGWYCWQIACGKDGNIMNKREYWK